MNTNTPKIFHIHSVDGGGGGALVAYNLMDKLNSRDITSELYVGSIKISTDPRVKYLSKDVQLINRFANLLPLPRKIRTAIHISLHYLLSPKRIASILTGKEYQNTYHTESKLKKLLDEKPDIIHCHNLHSEYFDLAALITLSQKVPVVITLHDAWLFTGHCAHFFDCMKWKDGCGNCQNLSVYPELRKDATAYNWKQRENIYKQCKLYITAPSKWVLDCAEESILANGIKKSSVIPNGINLKIFHPDNKTEARKKLNFPENKFIIIFAASGLKSGDFKDHTTLLKTLEILGEADAEIYCIALGDTGDVRYFGQKKSVEIHYVPFVSNPASVAAYYKASDVYVHPAKAETFGLVIIEAEACGLPVIASKVGGIPELILEDETGYLIPVGDAEKMAQSILKLKEGEGLRKEMGRKAAELAKERYDEELMVQRYIEFYRECIEDWKGEK